MARQVCDRPLGIPSQAVRSGRDLRRGWCSAHLPPRLWRLAIPVALVLIATLAAWQAAVVVALVIAALLVWRRSHPRTYDGDAQGPRTPVQ